ncbi:MAG: glycosyltransferase family 39 protein [bacterium]|nr:glycosyltransferase family 39 protein [bacterium]
MKRHQLILIGILALALTVRLLGLSRIAPIDFYAAPWYSGEGGDAAEYSAIAVNLADGQGFTLHGQATSIRPPLYVFFLAGVYKLFGNQNLSAVRIVQIGIAITALALFWFFARAVLQNIWGAHLGTLALALHPRFAVYNLVILTETIFTALILAMFWFAVRFYRSQKTSDLTLAMGILALAALTRPTALYFAPLLIGWAWWVADNSRIAKLLPGLLLFVALTGMWVARNYVQFHALTFSNKSGGGLAEAWDKTILEPLGISDRDILAPYKDLDEEAFARIGYKIFFTEIRDHPLLIAKIAWQKLLYWFSPFVNSSSAFVRMLHAAMTTSFFVLGIWGLYRYARKFGWTMPLLFLLLFFAFTAMHVLTVPYHRYRFPVMDPYLILFAAYAIFELWNKIGLRHYEK